MIEQIITLDLKQMELCSRLSNDAVEYFRVKKANGRSGYRWFGDDQREKRFRQTMCGVMAEYATSIYLKQKKIKHSANLFTHLQGFNKKTFAEPDFIIEINEQKRFLEVKSNQLASNARFFRMITPQHYLAYKKNQSLVLWCSSDIDQCQVQFYGFSDVEIDFQEGNFTYVKTCVDNYQLNKNIPCRHFGEDSLMSFRRSSH